jgi:hypothetical protein
MTARHKRLQITQVRSTKKGEIKMRSTDMSYLANRVDDITQRPQRRIQGACHELDPGPDLLLVLLLRSVIEGEECHPRVPLISPPEGRPLPRV